MKLIFTDTDNNEHSFELGSSTTVGRSPDADLVMDDEKASRMHFAIHQEDGVFVLHDLQSRNGTFLNSARVDVQTIKPGDQIRAGAVSFLVRGEDGARGPNTAINLVHEQMEDGKGYGTILREIVSDTKPKKKNKTQNP